VTQAAELLELQRLDLDIFHAKKNLDELPEKRAILDLRHKIRDVAALRGKADLLIRKLQAELKAQQDEIETLTGKIDEEQAKVMATSDHRQVASLTREMDGLRRRKDKLEMQSLGVMERVQKATEQAATIDAALEQLTAKERAAIEEFKTVGGALQAEIVDLEAEREKVAAKLNVELLGEYEAIREAKSGLGVGRLEGEMCSACHMSLPAERVNDLRSGPDISVCPQCHRLIVVLPETE
jgi:uncharacterized protein